MAMNVDSGYGMPSPSPVVAGGGAPPDGPSLAQGQRRAQRRAGFLSTYDSQIAPYLDPVSGSNMSPKQKINMVKGQAKSLGPGLGALNRLRDAYGYGDAEKQFTNYAESSLNGQGPGAVPDLHHTGNEELGQLKSYANQRLLGDPMTAINDVPTLAKLSTYARERLGTGLTPAEMAALRNPQIESVEANAATSRRNAADTAARSGFGDPRMGAVASSRIENQRMQGRADVGRQMTLAELQRKKEIEDLSTNVAGQEAARRSQVEGLAGGVAQGEENARQFDTTASENRRQRLEQLLGQAGEFQEGRREYDVGMIEARRNSKINRRLMEQALRRAQPTGLENASAILGGINQGLQQA